MNILLTGATGYIGGRLRQALPNDPAVRLRLLVRDRRRLRPEASSSADIVEGSTFDRGSLYQALRGIDVAYYLIHSMTAREDFEKLDRLSAANFLDACLREGVKRIIYLGGLGHRESASKHLLSRLETGEILSSEPELIQTICFRAGVIIGAGSASFLIIRNLVAKLPVMTTPRWVRTMTQPIGIDDVVRYLVAAKDLNVQGNLIVDIGSDRMTFKEILGRTARLMGRRRLIVPIPVLSPRLSSYWLVLLTPVPVRMAKALIDGLKSETVVANENARIYFPNITPIAFEDALRCALSENC
jgi:uncharacterized protein YbjT (DUF2867 family)